jgi:ribosomal protein S18 acetylase RimI-like enzyme
MSKSQITYRFATILDSTVIMKGLLEILYIEEHKKSFSPEKKKEQLEIINHALNLNSIIVSETAEQEVIGFIWFTITNKSFYGLNYGNLEEPYMFISYIWVLASARRTGIATKLYETIINNAKKNNIKKVWLDIYSHNNKSIDFHKKLGFTPEIVLFSKNI